MAPENNDKDGKDDKTKKSVQDLQQELEVMKEMAAVWETLQGTVEDTRDAEEKIRDGHAKALAGYEEEYTTKRKILDTRIATLVNDKETEKITEAQFKLEVESLKVEYKKLAMREEIIQLKQKEISLEEERRQSADKALATIDSNTKSLLLSVTGIGTAWKNGFVGSIIDARKRLGGFGPVLKQMGKSFKETFSAANVFGSIMTSIVQTTIGNIASLDSAQANFVKQTGTTVYAQQSIIKSTAEEQRSLGMTFQESTENMGTLMSSISGFRKENDATRKSLLASANTFKRLGVDIKQFSNLYNVARKSLGMTGSQAEDLQKRLISLSGEVSASQAELSGQFIALQGDLAQFGSGMEDQFIKLAKMSDKTAISMGKLVGIAKKFDSFKGAARSVGRLNTVIGKNVIDTKKIIGLDFAGKIAYLSKQLRRAGVDFQTMGRHRQKQLAQELGTDVATMRSMLSGEIDKENLAKEKLNITDKKMNELAKQATPIMQMMKATMQELAIALQPVVEVLRDVVTWFASLSPTTKKIIIAIPLVISGLILLGKTFTLVTAPLKIFGLMAAPAAGAGFSKLGKGIGTGGAKAAKGVPGWLGAALAIGLIVAAFALLIHTVGEMASKTSNYEGVVNVLEALTASVMWLVGAMVIIGALASSSGPYGWAAIAAGFAVIGGAVLLLKFLIDALIPALVPLATIFSSIAIVGGIDPFAAWITGLIAFGIAVKRNMSNFEGFKELLISMKGILPPKIAATVMTGMVAPLGEAEPDPANLPPMGRHRTRHALESAKVRSTPIAPTEGVRETTAIKAQVLEVKTSDGASILEEIRKMTKTLVEAVNNQNLNLSFEGKINENVLVKFIEKNAKKRANLNKNQRIDSLGGQRTRNSR